MQSSSSRSTSPTSSSRKVLPTDASFLTEADPVLIQPTASTEREKREGLTIRTVSPSGERVGKAEMSPVRTQVSQLSGAPPVRSKTVDLFTPEAAALNTPLPESPTEPKPLPAPVQTSIDFIHRMLDRALSFELNPADFLKPRESSRIAMQKEIAKLETDRSEMARKIILSGHKNIVKATETVDQKAAADQSAATREAGGETEAPRLPDANRYASEFSAKALASVHERLEMSKPSDQATVKLLKSILKFDLDFQALRANKLMPLLRVQHFERGGPIAKEFWDLNVALGHELQSSGLARGDAEVLHRLVLGRQLFATADMMTLMKVSVLLDTQAVQAELNAYSTGAEFELGVSQKTLDEFLKKVATVERYNTRLEPFINDALDRAVSLVDRAQSKETFTEFLADAEGFKRDFGAQLRGQALTLASLAATVLRMLTHVKTKPSISGMRDAATSLEKAMQHLNAEATGLDRQSDKQKTPSAAYQMKTRLLHALDAVTDQLNEFSEDMRDHLSPEHALFSLLDQRFRQMLGNLDYAARSTREELARLAADGGTEPMSALEMTQLDNVMAAFFPHLQKPLTLLPLIPREIEPEPAKPETATAGAPAGTSEPLADGHAEVKAKQVAQEQADWAPRISDFQRQKVSGSLEITEEVKSGAAGIASLVGDKLRGPAESLRGESWVVGKYSAAMTLINARLQALQADLTTLKGLKDEAADWDDESMPATIAFEVDQISLAQTSLRAQIADLRKAGEAFEEGCRVHLLARSVKLFMHELRADVDVAYTRPQHFYDLLKAGCIHVGKPSRRYSTRDDFGEQLRVTLYTEAAVREVLGKEAPDAELLVAGHVHFAESEGGKGTAVSLKPWHQRRDDKIDAQGEVVARRKVREPYERDRFIDCLYAEAAANASVH